MPCKTALRILYGKLYLCYSVNDYLPIVQGLLFLYMYFSVIWHIVKTLWSSVDPSGLNHSRCNIILKTDITYVKSLLSVQLCKYSRNVCCDLPRQLKYHSCNAYNGVHVLDNMLHSPYSFKDQIVLHYWTFLNTFIYIFDLSNNVSNAYSCMITKENIALLFSLTCILSQNAITIPENCTSRIRSHWLWIMIVDDDTLKGLLFILLYQSLESADKRDKYIKS